MRAHLIAAATKAGLIILLTCGLATAAEVKVFSAVAMKPVLDDLTNEFERVTPHKVTITYAVAGELPQAHRERGIRGYGDLA